MTKQEYCGVSKNIEAVSAALVLQSTLSLIAAAYGRLLDSAIPDDSARDAFLALHSADAQWQLPDGCIVAASALTDYSFCQADTLANANVLQVDSVRVDGDALVATASYPGFDITTQDHFVRIAYQWLLKHRSIKLGNNS